VPPYLQLAVHCLESMQCFMFRVYWISSVLHYTVSRVCSVSCFELFHVSSVLDSIYCIRLQCFEYEEGFMF